MNTKKATLTNELFKDKIVPEFFRQHPMFSKPMKLTKIFPSIGLPNFIDKTNIQKSFAELKKETSYVMLLLSHMSGMVYSFAENASFLADRLQWLDTKDGREKNRALIDEHYRTAAILISLSECIDTTSATAMEATIQLVDGKVSLVLSKDIMNNDGSGKALFRKGEGLFRIFGKLKEKADKMGILFHSLEQNDYFKNFCKENVPNKDYTINFSSDGNEGAWNIITMSMRGIKSCQRWDGEYPKCLIGSVLSKFVGIIYLTSGVSAETNAGYRDLGTKMIRRCVVRYAIDADSKKPHILLDKMYPDYDKDIAAAFMQSIQSRTTLPVQFTSDIGNKIRHMYYPAEKIREEISDRELSYQDTPLKSRQDLDIHLLDSNKEDLEKDVKGFYINLGIFIANSLEKVYTGSIEASDDLKIAASNIRSNVSFAAFADQIMPYISRSFKQPSSRQFKESKSYYRKFLLEFLRSRKLIALSSKANISVIIDQNSSRTLNKEVFLEFITKTISQFIKSEAKRLIN